jgi:hypothetical protein
MGFGVDKVALEQVSHVVLPFFLVIIIPPMLHTHHLPLPLYNLTAGSEVKHLKVTKQETVIYPSQKAHMPQKGNKFSTSVVRHFKILNKKLLTP